MTSFLDLCGKACLIVSHDRIEEEEGEGFACKLSPRLNVCLEGTKGEENLRRLLKLNLTY